MSELKKMTKLELKEWLQNNGYNPPEGNKLEVLNYALKVYPQVQKQQIEAQKWQVEYQLQLHNYLSNTLIRTYGKQESLDTSWRRCQHTILEIVD